MAGRPAAAVRRLRAAGLARHRRARSPGALPRAAGMNGDALPVDELPNGLPLFNLFLHVPAFAAKLQLFRLVRSYVVDRFTLHTLLVHPQEVDALPTLAETLGFLQLHG